MWKIKRSKIHGTGIFATQNIKKNIKVIRYIGEKITKKKVIIDQKKELKNI